MADKADNSANCVAENSCLHNAINKATKAAVPKPPHRFSTATTVAMNATCGAASASIQ